MSKVLEILIYNIITVGLISCNSYTVTSMNQADRVIIKTTQTSEITQPCDDWEKQYQALRKVDKKIVDEEGIVSVENGWVISPNFISDCDFRIDMATYLYRYRLDNDTWAVEFANKNSKSIVDVLRKIWNAPHFSVDGNKSEKYFLLIAEGLKDEDTIPFIKELVQEEGILSNDDNQLDYILFEKPIPSLRPIILKFLKDAEKNDDLIQQGRLLILLEREKKEPSVSARLTELSNNNQLNSKSRKILSKIVSKLEKGEEISYRDMDNLE